MAVPSNTVTAHVAIGNREDLADVIYDISPTETPFLTMAMKNSASNVYHEWQTDSLEAAGTNRAADGDDAAANTHTPSVRVGNYCQISRKTVSVSGTQRASNPAGRADELSYQISKRGKELKRDMEYALTRNQASSAGGVGETARSLASIESWLATNKTTVGTTAATATTPGFASGAVAAPTDTTTQGTITEAVLKSIIQQVWSAGGEPGTILVGPVTKQKISGMAGIATQYRDNQQVGPGVIIAAADIYVSDFGQHSIVPSRFSRERTALVLDMDYWAVSTLRNITREPLAKTGDSDKEMLLVEYTLESKNEAASGKITDITSV